MRRLPLALTVVLFATWRVSLGRDRGEYKAKDGTRVMIFYKSYESRLEFYSPRQELLCALDYSSEDHEHGFGVLKAAWTPDNNYFVFSLTSSGGHQAWHAPTLFYSVRDSEIRSLDSYTHAIGISKGDFKLKSPNIVLTEVLTKVEESAEESTPVKFRLDSLVNSSHKSPHTLQCTDGRVIRAEH